MKTIEATCPDFPIDPRSERNTTPVRGPRLLEGDPIFSVAAAAVLHLSLLCFAKVQLFERFAPLIPAEGLAIERWAFFLGVGLNSMGDLALYVTLWLWLSHASGPLGGQRCSRRLFGALAVCFVPCMVWSICAIITVRFVLPPLEEPAAHASIGAASAAIGQHLRSGVLATLISARFGSYVLAVLVSALVLARTACVGRTRALLAVGAYLLVVGGVLMASGILLAT